MHIPVLLKETIELLNPQPGEFFIDGTIGGAGHAIEIIKRIGLAGKLLGIDWDESNIKKLIETKKLGGLKNVILVHGNYADLPEILEGLKDERFKSLKADGLLLDLGMSSDQLEKSGRGFSFQRDEPLDMRYLSQTITDLTQTNTEKSQYKSVSNQYGSVFMTAAEVINSFSEKDLADIFFKYGEERFSRRIAQKIIEERRKKRILTTFDLVAVIKKAVPNGYEKGRIHPATRVFQALRIYVNDELGNLERLLKNLDQIVSAGKGRVVIISYHSLEDRLVKNYFRQMAKENRVELLTKKPIRPTEEEVKENPRSRSAKLRAIIFTSCDDVNVKM